MIFDPCVKRYKVTLRGGTCERAQGCRFSVSGQRAPVYGIMIDRETSKGGMEEVEKEEDAKEDERCDGCERRCKRNEARRDAFRDPFTRLGYARRERIRTRNE